MLNKLLAAAAIAAIAYAIVPANAAKVSAGCSSANRPSGLASHQGARASCDANAPMVFE